MNKKFVFSVLASAALLFVSAGANNAEAASPYSSVEKKIYVYQTSDQNIAKFNAYVQTYLQNCRVNWQSANKGTPIQQPVKTPAQQPVAAPVQQKPVQVPAAPAPQPTAPVNDQTPAVSAQVSTFEQQVVDLTNQERTKRGLPALTLDTDLSKAARAKSLDMKTQGYFNHTSPTYGSPFDMMKQFGISFRGAGENIAMGQRSPQEVMNAWMNSQGHRANILNSSFTHIGVGHVADGNYWTQMFISK